MTLHAQPGSLEHIVSAETREVPFDRLLADAGGDLERFVHLTPPTHPMARHVIAFGGCPCWRSPGHRSQAGVLLTLWLTPTTARCTACGYIEPLAAFLERHGMELA